MYSKKSLKALKIHDLRMKSVLPKLFQGLKP